SELQWVWLVLSFSRCDKGTRRRALRVKPVARLIDVRRCSCLRVPSTSPPAPISRSRRGRQVAKCRGFSLEQIDVCVETAGLGGVAGHGAGADGRYPHVSDKSRRVDGLPFRVEQVLGADQDQGLRLDGA